MIDADKVKYLYSRISDLQDEVEALEDIIDSQDDEMSRMSRDNESIRFQLSQLISYPDDTPEGRLS